MDKLTLRQQALLRTIQEFWEECGYAPTYRDLIDRTDFTSTSMVNYNLNRLEQAGFIRRERGISRSIRPVSPANGKPKAACSICGAVGEVQAGPSGVTIECPEHGVYFRYEVAQVIAA